MENSKKRQSSNLARRQNTPLKTQLPDQLLSHVTSFLGEVFKKQQLDKPNILVAFSGGLDSDSQELVMSAIYKIKSLKASHVREESNKILVDIANLLIKKGSQGIIAGCTEIPLALKSKDLIVPLFDPILILAKAAVREAQKRTSFRS